MAKTIAEISVKIYLPTGLVEEFCEGEKDVTKIMELEGVPGIMLAQGKSEITYVGFPYVFKEKIIE